MAGGGRTSWKSLFFPLRKLGVGLGNFAAVLLLDVEQKNQGHDTVNAEIGQPGIVFCLIQVSPQNLPINNFTEEKNDQTWAKGKEVKTFYPIYHWSRFCIRNGKSNSGPWKWNFVVPIFDTLELWHHLLAKKYLLMTLSEHDFSNLDASSLLTM